MIEEICGLHFMRSPGLSEQYVADTASLLVVLNHYPEGWRCFARSKANDIVVERRRRKRDAAIMAALKALKVELRKDRNASRAASREIDKLLPPPPSALSIGELYDEMAESARALRASEKACEQKLHLSQESPGGTIVAAERIGLFLHTHDRLNHLALYVPYQSGPPRRSLCGQEGNSSFPMFMGASSYEVTCPRCAKLFTAVDGR